MYLKRLELLGFKSFADKVEIVFQPGITAVIGPNGCGKSNISDALRWVLGEQSMKALRGAKMDDIIFAGSDERKSLGMAEVELTLDNSDGLLALDFAEVSVARRLYRSGESEYLLNKTPVRLRDIQEIFLDTGLGKEAYSVIGQGKIDAILSARAEERRGIFEEAAGVVKYKLRKAATMRRLEETEANLLRVLDLLTEIESQLGPLQNQALVAEQSLRLQADLSSLEINLIGHELVLMTEAITKAESGLALVLNKDADLAVEESVIEAQLEQSRLSGLGLDEEVNGRQSSLYGLGNRLEQERGKLELIQEKMRTQQEKQEELARLRRENENRRMELLDRRTLQLNALGEIGKVRKEIASSLENSESRIMESDSQQQDMIGREEELKAEIIEDLNQVAGARNSIQARQMEHEYLVKAIHELSAKMSALASEEQLINERLAGAENERQAGIDAAQLVLAEENALSGKRALAQKNLTANEAKNQQLRENIKELESRLKLLEEMERTYQGYFPGVRSVLVEARSETFAKGIRGLVAELITVKPGYELAMEIALGSGLQFVVIEEEKQAQEAIKYLKHSARGRATFLPLDLVGGRRAAQSGPEVVMQACDVHHAGDLLDFDPDYRGIIDYLLGNTLVASNLAQAVELAKQTGKAFRIVTKEGEVISVGGAMTGGALDQRKPQILGRKREIDDLRHEKEARLGLLAQSSGEATRLKEELAHCEAEAVALAARSRELAVQLAAADKTVENYHRELTRIRDDVQLLQYQMRENEDRTAALATTEAKNQAGLAEAESTLASHRQELENLVQQLKRHQNDKDRAFQDLSDLKVALATKTEEEKNHREMVAATEKQLSETAEDLTKAGSSSEEIVAAIGCLEEEEGNSRQTADNLLRDLEAEKTALEGSIAARDQGQQAQKKYETRLRSLHRERQGLADQAHRFELSLGEWRVRVETQQTHLSDTYGTDWGERMETSWEMEREEAGAKIESLRAEIRALGPVNPTAIEEYEALRNRYEFLRRQSNDLIQAKESLQRIIVEVERTISRRFQETLEAVRAIFNTLFQRLFLGGKADLLLLDPENPLDSGIEIVAQPPGKRLQSLSLLSGGERAMTAIALVFSILEFKPSPFCILDEIDATLDEANVIRFAELLASCSQKMQFIVVTHRRGTMDVANALYGVTMADKGVSKLISVNLEKAG